LTASRVNGHLQITLDPYGASIPLSKIQGGTVGGIQSFDDQITSMEGQLDRLAIGFAKRVNDQHTKGADLDGKKGLAFFSTTTLSATPSKSNKGVSSATIDMGQVGALENGDYRATFSKIDNKWTIVNTASGVKAAGTDRVTIDGMTIRFTGKPSDGDTYTFSPLTNAASALRMLIEDPRQLAASLPQLAEAVTGNLSSALIEITNTGGLIDPPPAPSLSALFNQSTIPNNAIGFKKDGIVSAIPAGSGSVSLYSFGEISAATFKIDPKASTSTSNIATLSNIGTAQLRLTVNGTTTPDLTLFPSDLFPNGITDAASLADPAQALADEINRILAEHEGTNVDLGSQIFASATNGYVTLNALGTNEISAATITGSTALSSASAAITQKSAAAEIDLVTREGIQLAGANAVPADYVKAANGFMAGAVQPEAPTLSADSSGTILSRSYRSLNITDSTSPIANQQSLTDGVRTSAIKFDVTSQSDSPSFTQGSSPTLTPGAVYSLAIDGLSSPIRLAGKSIMGKTSAEIASLMADRLTQLAPQRSLVGSAVTLPDNLATSSFTIGIDGVQSTVTFTRSRNDITGDALWGGTFSVSGDPRLSVSFVPADSSDPEGAQKLIIALPKSLSTTPPVISISGDDVSKFGLVANGMSEQIIASKTTSSDLATIQATLNAQFGLSSDAVSLTDDDRVLITKSLSGSLTSLGLTDLSTATESNRDEMTAIGFSGSDLTLSLSGNTLSLSSKVVSNSATPNLTDTSETVSRVGHKLTIASTQIDGTIPEDLLISLQQNDLTGTRSLAATYDKVMDRINPLIPDLEVDVTDDGIVSLYALKLDSSGALLRDENGDYIKGDLIAKRAYQSGIPVEYMGAQFVIDGNAVVGDRFRITTDASRTGDNRNALALIDIGRSDLLNNGSGTFADIYAAAVSKIGSSAQAAKTSASAAKTVADNVAAAYDSATGVNLDAEAAELIKLQQAYSACAQIVSTARDMFDMILRAF
jgi:flagellar hook-associated protein FlgK